jgi:hypothetical protein
VEGARIICVTLANAETVITAPLALARRGGELIYRSRVACAEPAVLRNPAVGS